MGRSQMEQTVIFSQRIRWLAIATGSASALALLPILFFLYPAFLIAGGYVQPRFPTTGKWFVWAGAANLWVVVIEYDAMMFPHPWGQTKDPEYMVLPFAATTVLLAWFSVELVADALRRMRVRRAMPPAEPRPLSRGVWILAAVLNLWLGWVAAGWVLAPRMYRSSGNFYSSLAMLLVPIATVMVLNICLLRSVLKLRRAPRADL
jgi:hypothetical protein